MRSGSWTALLLLAVAAARPLPAQDDVAGEASPPLPRYGASLSFGRYALGGRPYAFVDPYYRGLRFEAGPLVRLDGMARVAGPLSLRLGASYAQPSWELAGVTCECGNYEQARGLHPVALTFVDLGARIALLRSPDAPPDRLYLDLGGGLVHQKVLNLEGAKVPGASSTTGTVGLGVGGTYSLRDDLALTLQLADLLTRFVPTDVVRTRRQESHSIMLTVGLELQRF